MNAERSTYCFNISKELPSLQIRSALSGGNRENARVRWGLQCHLTCREADCIHEEVVQRILSIRFIKE